MSKNLVIVESPAKARTIKKYLGPGFEVLASYGHVRDLLPKSGAVDPEADFAMHYELIAKNSRHVDAIVQAMRKADSLYLATDLDREGEAISWHLSELLKQRKVLGKKSVQRIVFHEITRQAIQEALAHPRDIARELVDAQQARRALDYLVGFNLSPLLWKKVRRGLSAGRVQSPALRLICEREAEIEKFQTREYWTIEARLRRGEAGFGARLLSYRGTKVEQFSFEREAQAREACAHLEAEAAAQSGESSRRELVVSKIERKQRRRQPAAPFITSTLQQEAVRKLGFTAQRAMRVAQQLYEGVEVNKESIGLITYMRTDSVNLAKEAVDELRGFIEERYGADTLPESPRSYKPRSKNAQEAHEAIRPTSPRRVPAALKAHLSDEQYKLYDLIWRRTVACQMIHATIDTVSVDLACGGDCAFRATGSTVRIPGFLAVYEEGREDAPAAESDSRALPPLEEGERLALEEILPEQHFTEPPPRYSEASLVKALEEFGIGRPSTYASIISTLQAREYTELQNKRFVPTDIGRIVNRFLTEHFGQYVDYTFTANLEDTLDAVSRGERDWKGVMHEFWGPFAERVRDKEANVSRDEATQSRELGTHPKSGEPVSVRMGRFGPFVQVGSVESENKPRFYSLRPGQRMDSLTLDDALQLMKLPRDLGQTREGEPMSVNIGRFGPYVRFGSKFASLGKEDDPYTIEPERAQQLVDEKRAADAAKEIKTFEEEGIRLLNGRYGPYATDGKRNARLPKDRDPHSLTLEEVRRLLDEAPTRKRASSSRRPRKAASAEA